MNRDDYYNEAKGAWDWLLVWGHAHTAASCSIIGFAAGFLAKWIWF